MTRKRVNQAYHYWTNYRVDVKSILDHSGQEVGYYQYDTYGNILSENGKIEKDNSFRYAGYYYDFETKNYYIKARYYNPTDSNFLSIDPYPGDEDLPISQNGYNYTNNNPLNLVDTNGEANDKSARLIGLVGWARRF
ncbi:hypothetical protein J6TS2_33050 [Heyndrickxia sporothermodurans]|nr:hypothetical protein J6TS2_33050 [Heyndrickxia sporothermodurans]